MLVTRMLSMVALALCVAAGGHAQTLSGNDVQLHEGEVVPGAQPSLHDGSGSIRVERSIVGGLAPGQSSAASGLRLDGSTVSVPEPSSGSRYAAVLLGLAALASWRSGKRR